VNVVGVVRWRVRPPMMRPSQCIGRCLIGVKSSPADSVVYTAEDPEKADRIAAAHRTVSSCQCTKSLPR
jgi:(2Fe-2S) ferredoxin